MSDFLRAAFRTDPVEIERDGITYVFPSRTAAGWLGCFAGRDWPGDVLRLAEEGPYEAFLARAEAGELTRVHLQVLARDVLARVSGRRWWEAERLIGLLKDPESMMLGNVMQHADPARMSLAAFLAVEHALLLGNVSDVDRMKIESELSVPPPGAEVPDDQTEDFAATVARARAIPGVSIG